MARSRKNGSVALVTSVALVDSVVDQARATYIASLETRRTANLADDATDQQLIEKASASMLARLEATTVLESELRQLGVEFANPVSRIVSRRGHPVGSRNRAAGVSAGRKRHSNEVALPDAILIHMGSQPDGTQFSLDDIQSGILSAGYLSTSSSLKVIINQALSKALSRSVKRVSRGIYVLTATGHKNAKVSAENLSAAAAA